MDTQTSTHGTKSATLLRRAARRVTVGAAALVTAVVAAVSVAGPASASYTLNYGGRTGTVRLSGTYGVSTAAFAGYQFVTPNITVYRNGASDPSLQQEVHVTTSLQRWTGSGWQQVAGITLGALIPIGSGMATTIPGTTLASSVRSPGYFRVVTQVVWGSTPGPYQSPTTGYWTWTPNQSYEMICGFTSCQNWVTSYGSLYVWG